MLLLFLFIQPVYAQTKTNKKDLEKKKEQLLKEIDETNRMLKLNEKNKTATKSQLAALAKKLKARQELINTINEQLSELSGAIVETGNQIVSLQSKMDQLKKDYAAMIRYAYKNQNSYQRMMFVFSSDDFNQAFKRVKYLQQYSAYRKKQAEEIENTQKDLGVKKNELEQQKQEKTVLKVGEEKEKKNLAQEKIQQEQFMKNLTVQEQTLRKQLAEKQAQKKKLEAAIEAAIKKEIEAAKKKATAAGKKNVTKENAIAMTLTPEAQKLSSNFAGNRGSLPWPVEQGNISEYFGEHAHPTLKGVTIKNDGIDITTNRGASARSIFQGEVTAVIGLPGSGSAVIVRHGEYLSVYSNLETVAVKKGDNVTTKQKIGTVGNDSETGKGLMNLQIWKGFDKLNPQIWVARK
ncbi:MAG: peptidoglycan DD-metalloendopeptidase family protein [Bacteroidia bacterium]